MQDAVNRRIAMKMMVETAAAADQTQFILITPQDMGVRFFRIARHALYHFARLTREF